MPIQDEKHEVVLFLCSHKDITKQKLQEQQRHQLAQLYAQRQQQLADQYHQAQQQQQHELPMLTSNQHHSAEQRAAENTGSNRLEDEKQQHSVGLPAGDAEQGEPGGKLNAAQEAELAAIANQNALISMDEFGIEDTGDDNEFDEGDESEDHDKQTASQYSRRRSRAVLYQLSGHYGDRRNVNMKSKLKLNNVSIG